MVIKKWATVDTLTFKICGEEVILINYDDDNENDDNDD